MRLGPDTFGWMIDAIVRSWGLLAVELSPEAGVYAGKVYRASLEWVPLPVLFGLAAPVGLTRERLAAEIDRQLGLMTTQPRPEQGWPSPPTVRQEVTL